VIPNLYAGQIHYLSARSSDGKPLELSARGAASQPLKIQFERQPATLDAPWLHWCRSRIQRLVAEGDNTAAVALSVKSNLICPLTAFIAWDDSQKVPIANHELVQPSLELDGAMDAVLGEACRFATAAGSTSRDDSFMKAKRARGGFLFRRAGGVSDVRQEQAASDELGLVRELSDICHKTGMPDWELLVKALVDWIAEATEPERSQRLESLKRLVEELKPHAERFEQSQASQKPKEADEARAQIHKILKGFLDRLAVRK
jgi:hypothetical protein